MMSNFGPRRRNAQGIALCDRCGRSTLSWSMSSFDEDSICLACVRAERAHPAYRRAVEADDAAIRGGDFNYSGIGLPADLKGVRP